MKKDTLLLFTANFYIACVAGFGSERSICYRSSGAREQDGERGGIWRIKIPLAGKRR